MSSPVTRRLAAPLLESFLVCAPSLAFLLTFRLSFDGSHEATLAHLGFVFAWLFTYLCLRLVLGRVRKARLRSFFSTALLLVAVSIPLLFGAIAWTGMNSWGRVPSWSLISTYVAQADQLVRALGIGLGPLIGGLAFLAGFAVWASRQAVGRLDWPERLSPRIPAAVLGSMLCLAAGIGFARILDLHDAVHASSGEPLTQFFHPGAGLGAGQGHLLLGARALEAAERLAAQSYRPGVRRHERNVILIVGDALRADRLGVLGYSRPTTPFLSSLDARGALPLKASAVAACAQSFCGLMAISRSRYVYEQAISNLSLGDVLRAHGYRVYLILGGDHTNFYGLSAALGPADFYWDGTHHGGYVNDDRAIVDAVGELPNWDGQPVMMQFHLMSTHELGARYPEFREFLPETNYAVSLPGQRSDPSFIAAAGNYYDNGIRQFDAVVDDLLEALKDRGYLDDAVVIITGDHGELLGEEGLFGHSRTVHDAVLSVPLMMARFGYQGGAVPPKVAYSHVDIAPTVLQELELPQPAQWSGIPAQEEMQHDFIYFQQKGDVGLLDLRSVSQPIKYWTDGAAGKRHTLRLRMPYYEQSPPSDAGQLHIEYELRLARSRAVLAADPLPSAR